MFIKLLLSKFVVILSVLFICGTSVRAGGFSYEMVKETGEGGWSPGGGGHGHAIILCEGTGILMLRTRKPDYHSIEERAKTIVKRLNRAGEIWKHTEAEDEEHKEEKHKLRFGIAHEEGKQEIYFVPEHGAEPEVIITITPGDIIGYARRSAGYNKKTRTNERVTGELVAYWWLSLLYDEFSLFVLGEKPKYTHETEAAKILDEIYHQAKKKSKKDEIDHEIIEEILDSLWKSQKLTLKQLATRIPEDFTGKLIIEKLEGKEVHEEDEEESHKEEEHSEEGESREDEK